MTGKSIEIMIKRKTKETDSPGFNIKGILVQIDHFF